MVGRVVNGIKQAPRITVRRTLGRKRAKKHSECSSLREMDRRARSGCRRKVSRSREDVRGVPSVSHNQYARFRISRGAVVFIRCPGTIMAGSLILCYWHLGYHHEVQAHLRAASALSPWQPVT